MELGMVCRFLTAYEEPRRHLEKGRKRRGKSSCLIGLKKLSLRSEETEMGRTALRPRGFVWEALLERQLKGWGGKAKGRGLTRVEHRPA